VGQCFTLDRLWKLAGFVPNSAQQNPILLRDGPISLSAGPGSAKTRVLFWRALNLTVFHEVPPDAICLPMFTAEISPT